MKLIVAFIQPHKLEPVSEALQEAGVAGMSISEVSGFGRQAGQAEVYRGAEYKVDFIPKVRLEILVDDDVVASAVDAIEASAHTGEIGDGKIIVLPAYDAVRIRTGERGVDAI